MTVEQTSEGLARMISRRTFMNRVAGALFGVVSTATVGGFAAVRAQNAYATGPCPNNSDSCGCHPLNNRYCDAQSASYCVGATCAGGCTNYTGIYPDACWCSRECCYLSGTCSAKSAYWKCCDCTCPHGGCTCHQFIVTCSTTSSPSSKSDAVKDGGKPRRVVRDSEEQPDCVPCC
jgi:hypothetical protein